MPFLVVRVHDTVFAICESNRHDPITNKTTTEASGKYIRLSATISVAIGMKLDDGPRILEGDGLFQTLKFVIAFGEIGPRLPELRVRRYCKLGSALMKLGKLPEAVAEFGFVGVNWMTRTY